MPETKFQESEDDQPVAAYQLIDLSVVPFKVIPPPSAVTSDGELIDPISIFLSSTVRVTELMVVVVPLIVKSPLTNKLPPIPTPPATIKAPEEKFVAAVEEVIDNPETLKISVNGLYTKLLSEETAVPDNVPETGVNNIGWFVFDEAATTLILLDVVANPEVVA